MPPQAAWNSKYEGVGNGGFAGSLIYPSMDWALEAGYAVSGTNTGHSGGSLDAGWALGHPEKIVDFGWRGIHETAAASKAIIEAYYGKAPARAYFAGCSDGGREALMEAQRFPKDYDGIVAGAPANFWTRLLTNGVWTDQALAETPDSWISPEKLSVVTDAALKACHGENGVLDDPGQCHFDPSSLLCKAGESNECLSAPQITALKKIYSGMQDASGKSVFPGYPPGGEVGPCRLDVVAHRRRAQAHRGNAHLRLCDRLLRRLWSSTSRTGISAVRISPTISRRPRKRQAQAVDAANPDLSAFRDAGGKLIQYHGWNDAAIPAQSSIDYYEEVAAKMGGIEKTQSFYRLFMAPGMQHCGLGLGPNAVGGVFGLPPPSRDPAHDVVAALAHWVEDGAAPDQIIATLYRDNDPSKGIAAQRPWCPHPASRPIFRPGRSYRRRQLRLHGAGKVTTEALGQPAGSGLKVLAFGKGRANGQFMRRHHHRRRSGRPRHGGGASGRGASTPRSLKSPTPSARSGGVTTTASICTPTEPAPALPGLPIPKAYGRYPSRAQVVEYLEAYAAKFALKPVFNAAVRAVRRDGRAWRAEAGEHSQSAPIVVVATGWADFPIFADLAGDGAFGGPILHSSLYRNPAPFAGKHVLVVGFGASGGEIALDLSGAGVDVALSVRGPVNSSRGSFSECRSSPGASPADCFPRE